MSNIKQVTEPEIKSVIRISETPSSHSSNASDKYLKNVIRESNSLLKKLSALPNINDYRKLMK
ncbi:hypothetical protein [Oceanobacillus halophilus]|uniref:Uncharacterized protein n=1 Tax=Oceanobacillus halophilus TaxID=930130 RepID=A0A494ZT97_9BACI|nr:hypothetical protein [Oceanobacillus halophilus]RKQ29336.1 hypothetical protein D8M06_17725 [Oceanobacillus halophilus]